VGQKPDHFQTSICDLLATEAPSDSFDLYGRYTNNCIYLSIYL